MPRHIVIPHLEKHEGFKTTMYLDSKKNPTIGAGLNLNDPFNRMFLEGRGYKFDDIMSGREVAPEILRELQEAQIEKKETFLRDSIDSDFYDTLPEGKKAALQSMAYNNEKMIGPKLRNQVINGNDLDTMREIVLGSKYDKGSPGLLKRRLDEAQLYGGPDQMQNFFRSFTPEDKSKFESAKSNIQNENELQDFDATYGPYMKEEKPSNFNKLNDIMMNGITTNPIPYK